MTLCSICGAHFLEEDPHFVHITKCPKCREAGYAKKRELDDWLKSLNQDTRSIIYRLYKTDSGYMWMLRFLEWARDITAEGKMEIDGVARELKERCSKFGLGYHTPENIERDRVIHYFSESYQLSLWEKERIREKLEERGIDPNTFWCDLLPPSG